MSVGLTGHRPVRLFSCGPAPITAIDDIVPVAFPFFAPGKGAVADGAHFGGQLRFLAHLHTCLTQAGQTWFGRYVPAQAGYVCYFYGMNSEEQKTRIGIINVSDRASAGVYEDTPGKAVVALLTEWLTSPWEPFYRVIPDEQDQLEAAMIDMADREGCCLIVTTGGTGPALRDVTPEATEAICQKMMPGFGELMRQESLKYVPTAILSRQTAGIRNQTLILNLPGKPKAIGQCLTVIFPAIPYCIDLIGGPFLTTNEVIMPVFRPRG